MKESERRKNLYLQMISSEGFKKEVSILRSMLADSVWWIAEDPDKAFPRCMDKSAPALCIKSPSKRAKCSGRFRLLMQKAAKINMPVRFNCGSGGGICIPVIQNGKMCGYIGICRAQNEIDENIILLFLNFIEELLKELQKENELDKLHESMQPREVALSTIHTIHRILSSTLDIEELLPKIARLSMQVLRAGSCCILLSGAGMEKPAVAVIHVAADNGENAKKSASSKRRQCVRLIRNEVIGKGKIIAKKKMLCVPLADEDMSGAICVMDKAGNAPFNIFDKEILTTLSEQAAIAVKNARLYKEQEDITLGSIKSLAAILASRTHGSYKPKESFIEIIIYIGRELRLGADGLRNLHYAALLHDAGQIGFPDRILTKRAKLTGREYDIVKKHPKKGVNIIKHLSFMKPVIPIILHHHENYDGSGYPSGLKGQHIPLGARIMAVAGAFNAMITKRPYRQKIDIDNAISEIRKSSGSQFDPDVVKAFLAVVQKEEIIKLLKTNR